MNKIKLVKNRSDIGAGTRGSDLGIDAIEIAAISADSKYFVEHPFIDVETKNESIYNKVNAPFAKRITHVREQCERVSASVKGTLSDNYFPIVLSGDHSSALGTISGVKAHYPDKRLGVIWIDAHADLHSPFTSPSGNVHGMPLAAALGLDNISHAINDLSPTTASEWEALKNVGVNGAKLLPQDLIFFGVRDTETPEDQLMDQHQIRNYMVHEVRFRGLEVCVAEAIEQLSECDILYISFDVDSMDCDLVSMGTGTPVSKGFDPDEATSLMKQLIETQKVVCLEFTEVNPLLDTKGNKMAETAFSILRNVSEYISKK